MRTKHVARLLIEAKAEKRQRIYATSHDVSLWTLRNSQALARGRSRPDSCMDIEETPLIRSAKMGHDRLTKLFNDAGETLIAKNRRQI